MDKLPISRSTDIVVQELGNEILIYDLNTHKAYNLNETSTIVYQACGRNLNFEDLKRRYNFTDDVIHLALDELKTNNLIEDYGGNYFVGLSRREVIRKIGVASMVALPLISQITAPRAVDAQSSSCLELNAVVGCFTIDDFTNCDGNRCCSGLVRLDVAAPCSEPTPIRCSCTA